MNQNTTTAFKTLFEKGKLWAIEKDNQLDASYLLKNKKMLDAQEEEYAGLEKKSLLSDEPDVLNKLLALQGLLNSNIKRLVLLAQRVLKCKPVNNVFTTYVGTRLDIKRLIERGKTLNYNIKDYPKFTGVRLKVTEKINDLDVKYTLMFFKSGKINCLGINDETPGVLDLAVQSAKNKIYALLADESPSTLDFKLVNCVLSVKIPLHINLKHLYLFNELENWKDIKYNNQLFPGVITRPKDSKIRINFFSTGSAIFTGIRDKERRITATKIFLELLNDYLKKLSSLKL